MSEVKPFLKWAGGKRQLLPELRAYYPRLFGAYIEPFLGSGAVFFDLCNRERLDGHDVRLADGSADLITCYTAVRDHVDEVIAALEDLEAGHHARGERHYYEVRDARFNAMRRQANLSNVPLAAMLIYLNRTGYNGLFRVNSRGDFNVPMGRYERPRICDAPNLREVSAALRRTAARIEHATFGGSLAHAKAGDFVYLDPPYAPLTSTACFTAYTASGFGPEEQRRLREVVVGLASTGVHVLLSNSGADHVRQLYAEDRLVRAAGLRTHVVPARRAISSRGSARGPVHEYVITNVGC